MDDFAPKKPTQDTEGNLPEQNDINKPLVENKSDTISEQELAALDTETTIGSKSTATPIATPSKKDAAGYKKSTVMTLAVLLTVTIIAVVVGGYLYKTHTDALLDERDATIEQLQQEAASSAELDELRNENAALREENENLESQLTLDAPTEEEDDSSVVPPLENPDAPVPPETDLAPAVE